MPVGESRQSRPRQAAGACSSGDRNDDRLHQNLTEDTPAAGADCQPDGNLARAVGRPRREQTAEVGAAGSTMPASAISPARMRRAGPPSVLPSRPARINLYPNLSSSAGYCCRVREAIASSSACASGTVTPSFMRTIEKHASPAVARSS